MRHPQFLWAKASLGCPFADSTNNCDLSLQYSHARSVASLSSLKVATKLRDCDEPQLLVSTN